jgi:thioredoxin-dependent peroxiredoxin
MKPTHSTILACAVLFLAGCAAGGFTYKDLKVSKDSAEPGSGKTVAFRGSPLKLEGKPIKVGDTLHDAKLATGDLKLVSLTEGKGRVRIVSIVPSLDTKVCEQQTHYLSEKNRGLDRDVQLITVSVDTPFAQNRFAEEANIRNVTFLSDYRGGDFGRAYGLLIPDLHLLARSVMVVDKDNVVRYLQVVPEVASLPDMERAFEEARKVAGLPPPPSGMSSFGGSMGSMGGGYGGY